MDKIVKNKLDEVFTNDVIGQPMTPGHWKTKELEYTPITRLRMTAGGGMGGCAWFEYIKRIDLSQLTEGNRIVVEMFTGEQKMINLNNVVYAENMGIVSGVYHSENPNYTKGDYLYNILVKDGHKVKTNNNGYGGI